MIWKCVTIIYMLQNVLSLEYGSSSLPAGSHRRINNGRRKPSRIPSYPLESAIDSGNNQEVYDPYFPDVTYPRTILEVAQPFYYSQHGYDEVLGPFSNDIKSSYKNLGKEKTKIPLKDFSASPSIDNHKNLISLNTSTINNNSLDNTFNETYDEPLRPEDTPVNTEPDNTFTVDTEADMLDSTLYHIGHEYKAQEILQDMSEESHIINEDVSNIQAKDVQGPNIEENLEWEEIPATENPITSFAMNERDMLDRNYNNESYEEIRNNFEVTDTSNMQNETELFYTNDELNFINYLLNKIITSDKILKKHNIEKLDIINNNYSVSNVNWTLNGSLGLDINDNQTFDEINTINLYNGTNQEDEEVLNVLNSDTIEHIDYISPNIATLETGYGQEIKEILESDNSDNTTDVDLTPNHIVSLDINDDQKYTEALYVKSNNIAYNTSIYDDIELLDSEYNDTMQHFTLIPNYDELPTDLSENDEDTEMSETKLHNEIYVYETPNYVVTSKTGNTREDFVNDIMNIYSLIEETLRAVSVVEFVVSKTLDTLGPKENQNETIANEFTHLPDTNSE